MTTKRKARQEGKAQLMWADRGYITDKYQRCATAMRRDKGEDIFIVPLYVMDASESADAARIEAGAKAIHKRDATMFGKRQRESWKNLHKAWKNSYLAKSRAVLTAIGALSTPNRSTKRG